MIAPRCTDVEYSAYFKVEYFREKNAMKKELKETDEAIRRANQELADGKDLPDSEIGAIVEEYERTIESVPTIYPKQWMICVVGLVGAGKTTVLKPLSTELGLTRISNDDIRRILRKHGYNFLRTKDVASIFGKNALEKNHSLAIDADSLAPENREYLQTIADQHGIIPVWIHINPPEEFILNKLKHTVRYEPGGLFQNAEEGVANYLRRKPLHEQYLSEVSFDFTFDTSRPDLPEQIETFVQRVRSGEWFQEGKR